MPRPQLAVAAMAAVLPIALAPAAALAQPCFADELFGPEDRYVLTASSRDAAIGDLDGDGDADLAIAFDAADAIGIMRNNGDGTFAREVLYGAGDQPFSIGIADVDGDGDSDVITANNDSNDVSVLLNNGDGTFAFDVVYSAGSLPNDLAIADFDGDGDPDLAVANQAGGSVGILLNNGDGTFAADVQYAASDQPRNLATGDLDGDGDIDLAVVHLSAFVSVLLNNGDGTFGDDVTYDVPVQGSSVAIGDLDNDGDADLTVTGRGQLIGDDFLGLLRNNGDGTFMPAELSGLGSSARSIAISDLDADGDTDLAVVNGVRVGSTTRGGVSVIPNFGDGTFAPSAFYNLVTNPQSLAIGDLNGDGAPDLAMAHPGLGGLAVMLNTCVPSQPVITTQPVPVVLLPSGGGMAELRVVASGAAPLSYQWRRDGVPLADGGRVSGATTPTLTIDATVEDVANYDVVVSNSGGSVTSDVAVIAVRQPCRADFDDDGALTIFDFLSFSTAFDAGCP